MPSRLATVAPLEPASVVAAGNSDPLYTPPESVTWMVGRVLPPRVPVPPANWNVPVNVSPVVGMVRFPPPNRMVPPPVIDAGVIWVPAPSTSRVAGVNRDAAGKRELPIDDQRAAVNGDRVVQDRVAHGREGVGENLADIHVQSRTGSSCRCRASDCCRRRSSRRGYSRIR